MLFVNKYIKYIIERLRKLQYISRGIVFFADLLLSVFGTYLSFVNIIALDMSWYIQGSNLIILCCSAFISGVLFLLFGLYKIIIRHSTLKELITIFYILILKNIMLVVVTSLLVGYIDKRIVASAILDILITAFLMTGFRSLIVNIYYTIVRSGGLSMKNALMYGTTDNSPALAEQINKDVNSPYLIKGFLTTDLKRKNIKIAGTKIYYLNGCDDKLKQLIINNSISTIIFSSRNHFERESGKLVEFCLSNNIRIFVAGEMKCPDPDGKLKQDIVPVKIEDLLGRDEIINDAQNIGQLVKGKKVLITGAAGSIGSGIVFQLMKFRIEQLILFDCAETPLHNLQIKLNELSCTPDVVYLLGDIRSSHTVNDLFEKYHPDIVFHAAAYKHVPMIEANPCQSVLTNVWGTINLARHACKYKTERFVLVSTDKAVNPTNVMGASKRIAEMCVSKMNKLGVTLFITTRFGNVLGSNGSVIPLFEKQIAQGGPVTVTDPSVVRYFMTIPEACRLVLQAVSMGQGGEIFVFDMGEKVKIDDLARKMISLSNLKPDKDIQIVYTGLRPGEKLFEEVLTDREKTTETIHQKIRIFQNGGAFNKELEKRIRELVIAARRNNKDVTVRLMKQIVPEFISNNSEFTRYDTCEKMNSQ